ncbi:hypothetical protein TRIATDRAFT_307388 [Trichoderma atroviride IMI 206040]|uniref:Uncharacterized protein n=1 Tax=Hypocrea atroviridis (strain ATCC 20476 / IMI 206040) TaxID=452589 RepID=G9NRF4_HYPAI|nr:uncharacterized protein TRIATDRAFT_307388 [Trichoderma atroviride IMI 206040]EHK46588.1 hypothetical protein TRIATDRAFT_307388 [Trichoderma atroviride IMI 206040]
MLRGWKPQFQALRGHHNVVFALCDAAGKKLRCVEMEAAQTRTGPQALTRPAYGEKH